MKENTNQKGNGSRPRQTYDETYKRHAVELTLSPGRTIKAVAEDLGITPWTLYRWRELYAPRPAGASTALGQRTPEETEEENRRLRAEVLRLREREIVLKKSLGILSETPESGMPRSKR
jgi:transposase